MGYHFSPTAFVQTNLTRSPLLPHLRRMESSQTPLPPENARPSSTPIIYMPLGDVNAENEDLDEPVDPIFVSLLDEEDMDAAECSSGDRSLADPAGAVDFYSVLGVPRDAGLAEIRTSYKRLSRLLHPDRHCAIGAAFDSSMPDLELRHLRKSAQEAFGRISAAYAVLIDPNKRAIYDRFGFRGLNIDGWELALREKSAVELQLEYFKLRAKEREERQLRFTQPTSEFSLGVDMTDVFDRYLKEEPAEREIAPSLSVYEMVLKQSISAGATLRTSLSLVGEIVAQNGLGVGTWLLLCQRRFPAQSYFGPGTADVEVSNNSLISFVRQGFQT
ncbi:unnamed protein product [Protopolystoma xenopodis]|uniref:J domain-containing protein n=1 Tax=Protopolystoma xenopodis TaxID=117903 RepID=A0A448X1I3_9PLAT|nr:unnamed protein product [Protopolystoma xenopodis]